MNLYDNINTGKYKQLFSDGVIGFGVHRFVKLAAAFTRVYYYRHSFVGRFSHVYYPSDKPYGKFLFLNLVNYFYNAQESYHLHKIQIKFSPLYTQHSHAQSSRTYVFSLLSFS